MSSDTYTRSEDLLDAIAINPREGSYANAVG